MFGLKNIKRNKMEGKLVKTGNDYILYSKDKTVLGITSGTMEGRMLSLKNCQAIENGYDLEDLTDEYAEEWKFDERIGFRDGVKKYTDDDIVDAYMAGHIRGMSVNMGEYNIHPICSEYLNSLQQTEWDVEIVMDRIPADRAPNGWDEFPKLDDDGCLILTKNII